MKNIITIQHAQSEQHVNGMIGSWTDWELTAKGVGQAERIGERLAKKIVGADYVMYSSDLKRAKKTAEIVAGRLGIIPVFTPALREINLGEAVGKSQDWARENEIGQVKTIDDIQFRGSESGRDLWYRVKKFEAAVMSGAADNVIIVSHGGTLGTFHAVWLGLGVEALNKCGIRGGAGGVSFMHEDSDGKRIIISLNDRSYAAE